MSKQKVVFLYTSPAGEAMLNSMMQGHTSSRTEEDRTKAWESFMRAIHHTSDGHFIRVWFGVEYSEGSSAMAFLKRCLAAAPAEDIYFARFGENPDDVEEIGTYASLKRREVE